MSKPTKNQSKKTKKDYQIIVLIDLAVLQSVTLLAGLWHLFTMVVWGKIFLKQSLNYKLKLTVNVN